MSNGALAVGRDKHLIPEKAGLIALFVEAGKRWLKHGAARLGASLAYYTLFSLAPLFVIALAMASLVFDPQAASAAIGGQIKDVVGPTAAEALNAMIENADRPAAGIGATIVGIALLIFGAGGVFAELQDTLNMIWEVKPKEGRGWLGMLQDRFLSFAMVMGVCFLLLVSLIVSAGLTAFMGMFGSLQESVFGHVINFTVSLLVMSALFAMIYRFLPDAVISWRDVWLGGLCTAALFSLGKFLIGLYLGFSAVGSSYGAAGALAALLVWLYYSAQIFLFGAEVTKIINERHAGAKPIPTENAKLAHARS